jgi:putative hydrolase of the HAD superfamily
VSARPPRAVLFDAAGTLIHLREPVGRTYARHARSFGAIVPEERLEDAFQRVLGAREPMMFPGSSHAEAAILERSWWRGLVDDTFRAADGSQVPRPFESCFSALWDHYAGAAAWTLAPAAKRVLGELHDRGLATGVLSNFDQRLRNILQELGIHEFLDVVVIPADAGVAKPDPQIFHVALERLGLAGPQVAYVGDRAEHDVAGARAAGLRPVPIASLATLAELPLALGLPLERTMDPR